MSQRSAVIHFRHTPEGTQYQEFWERREDGVYVTVKTMGGTVVRDPMLTPFSELPFTVVVWGADKVLDP